MEDLLYAMYLTKNEAKDAKFRAKANEIRSHYSNAIEILKFLDVSMCFVVSDLFFASPIDPKEILVD